MKRKTFINRLTLAGGGAVLLPSMSLLQSCEYKPQVRTALTAADVPLLDEIGETIIPATDTSPGAKAAKIGDYMLLMYTDCTPPEDQVIFLDGLNELDARSAKMFKTSFLEANADQRLSLLQEMQDECTAYYLSMEGEEEVPPHYFNIFKGNTVAGYFSSEIGMTQARNYLPLPGKFEACIPYKEGDRPWAI